MTSLANPYLIADTDAVEPSSTSTSPLSSPDSLPDSDYSPVTPPHDPHALPVFSPTSLTHPSKPILYLPPLLSSLPYPHPPHIPTSAPIPIKRTETRLPDIDPASLSLHRALHHFAPVVESYAHAKYADAFNWDELELPEDEEREWYCVAFRSIRKQGSEAGPLYEADKLAHEEAVRNGGLILYWYGTPDPQTGLNLATCIWQSRAHAIAANARPHHIRAMRLAAASYDTYQLERYVLRKVRGSRGVEVHPFEGGNVGW
ncbi:hypothetical protein BV25DRAFT_1820988 [Artomyces pyxidatus]|uniref:Uncharacterized protein n=1 Tax=Artomyces pyxidatus TaxID=48021 RepID=A0ACB8TC34_9AGAM|nr:hypothetical protein BV25DRAFT_1820988 [Artomyces pyxidatus]